MGWVCGGRDLVHKILTPLKNILERRFPEKRLFLRSDSETRFVRLTPGSQLLAWSGGAFFVVWSIVATAFLLMDSIGSGSVREQAKREQSLYEQRLNDLSGERDRNAAQVLASQDRFSVALDQISQMQVSLLESEDRRKEMERGIEIIQATLRRTLKERDLARDTSLQLTAQMEDGAQGNSAGNTANADTESTVDFLMAALATASQERDQQILLADQAEAYAADLELERKLMFEKNDRIFSQLEDAVSLSLTPLDEMFKAAGMPTEQILSTVRQGYSGQGGPLMPITFSTRGQDPSADELRANAILERMDRMNLYRIAAEKTPFSMPTKSAFRYTSPFGPRSGRLHAGADLAGAMGSPLYATADGVVKFAGRQSGYGWVVIISHEFGIETRYAHQSKLRVKTGQRVSRGERIGDMGSSGRSSGSHVHYEVRVGGEPVDPMAFIKAAKNVF